MAILAFSLFGQSLKLNPTSKNPMRESQTYWRLNNYDYYVYNYAQSSYNHSLRHNYHFSNNYYADSLVIDTLVTSNWQKNYKYTYEYNQSQQLVTNYLYRTENNNWVPDYLDYYTYNQDFGTVATYLSKKHNGSSYVDYLQITYEYQNGFLVNETWQYFNTRQVGYYCTYELDENNYVTSKTWYYTEGDVPYSKVEYTYNDDNLALTEKWLSYIENAWVDYSKYDYSYDLNNNLTQVNGFLFYSNIWNNYSQKFWAYDENGNNTFIEYKLWDTDLTEFINQYKYDYFYESFVVSSSDALEAETGIINYPNPFNPSCKISFTVPQKQTANLSIYNIKGQLIKSYKNIGTGKQVVNFNGKGLASGVYFYRLDIGNKSVCKKMLMLK